MLRYLKNLVISLFFFLSCFMLSGKLYSINSLEVRIKFSSDTTLLSNLRKKAISEQLKNPEASFKIAETGIKESIKKKNVEYEIKFRLIAARCAFLNQDLNQSLLLYEETAANLSAKTHPLELTLCYAHIGNINRIQGNIEDAEEHLNKALFIRNNVKNNFVDGVLFNNLAILKIVQGKLKEGINYFEEVKLLREASGDSIAIGDIYNNIGLAYKMAGEYPLACNYLEGALKLRRKGNLSSYSQTLVNLALTFEAIGKLEKAVFFLIDALKINEALNDKISTIDVKLLLGSVYFRLEEYQQARNEYFSAETLLKRSEDKRKLSTLNYLLGNYYRKTSSSDSSYRYYKLAEFYSLEIGDNISEANALNGIGNYYMSQEEYSKAKQFFDISLEKAKIARSNELIIENLLCLGRMYLEREMPDSAKYYYILSKANEVSSNSFITQKSLFEGFYQVNEKLGNYKDAFENFKQFSAYSDSISSMRKQFNLTNLIKKYESEKKDKEIEILSKDKLLLGRDNEIQMLKIKEQEQGIQAFVLSNRVTQLELLSKQEKLKEQTLIALSSKKDNILLKTQKKLQEAKIVYGNEQISRRNILIYFFLVLIVLAVIFLAFLIYSNRLRRKANQKLKENNEMILLQKSQIEKKQTEILESVVYAKRIQNSILPTDKVMRELLGTYGVFYQPKDIVSGDFYWVYQSEDSVYFAVADCTGHGVPGAMVSVFGYNALRTVMDERKLRSPEQILSELHVIMEKSIKGLFDKIEVADGMDIGLCCINKRENQLWFSGANRPLYHFRNGMLNQIKGDKRGIGGHDLSESDTNIFKLHKIDIEKGDRFYLFSDGYADQFGVNKKKFMIQKLRNLLTSIQKETLSEQFNNLTQTFFSWKGVEEQTDDVLVLGIEV